MTLTRDLDQDTIRTNFIYCPLTGVFRRARDQRHYKAGSVTGGRVVRGYIRVRFNGLTYAAHRLAWIYVHGFIPENYRVDHINCDTSDNRICNLRLASPAQNVWNSRRRKNSSSGAKGVHWSTQYQKWKVQIECHGQKTFVGSFDDLNEAKEAYDRAAKTLFGEFARSA